MRGSTFSRGALALLGRRRARRDPPHAQIAGRLREARIAAGMTQEQLAERIGCAANSVSRAEGAKHQASPELVDAWLEACGCELVVTLARAPG